VFSASNDLPLFAAHCRIRHFAFLQFLHKPLVAVVDMRQSAATFAAPEAVVAGAVKTEFAEHQPKKIAGRQRASSVR